MIRVIGISSTIAILYLFSGTMLIYAALGLFGDGNRGFFIFVSFFSTALVGTSLVLQRPFDPFSPLSIIFFSVLLGIGVRAPYILLNEGSPSVNYLLQDFTILYATSNIALYGLGISALVGAYLITTAKFTLNWRKLDPHSQLRPKRFLLWASIYGAIGTAATIAYTRAAGIDLSGGLLAASGKQAIAYESGNGEVYGAGFQTFLGQLAEFPFYILAVSLLLGILRPRLTWIVVVLVLGAMAAAVPFIANTRMSILLLGLTVLIALYYFNRLKLGPIIIWAAISIMAISLLTGLRTDNHGQQGRFSGIADTIIASGNGLDGTRTSLIISLVPERVDFQYGQQLLSVFGLAIPRQFWPNKPNTALGPWIKQYVFGREDVRNHGWPPGIIAEGYLNFGFLGVVLLPALLGFLLKLYYNSFRPLLGRSLLGTLLYATTVWPLTFSTVSNNFALGIVSALYSAIPLLLLGYFVMSSSPSDKTSR